MNLTKTLFNSAFGKWDFVGVSPYGKLELNKSRAPKKWSYHYSPYSTSNPHIVLRNIILQIYFCNVIGILFHPSHKKAFFSFHPNRVTWCGTVKCTYFRLFYHFTLASPRRCFVIEPERSNRPNRTPKLETRLAYGKLAANEYLYGKCWNYFLFFSMVGIHGRAVRAESRWHQMECVQLVSIDRFTSTERSPLQSDSISHSLVTTDSSMTDTTK